MVGIYLVLTACLLPSSEPAATSLMLYEVARPFQIRARARNAGNEQSMTVWSLPQSEARCERQETKSAP